MESESTPGGAPRQRIRAMATRQSAFQVSADSTSHEPWRPRYLQPHFFRLYSKTIDFLSFRLKMATKPPSKKKSKEVAREP
jgi:hypothetical protein